VFFFPNLPSLQQLYWTSPGATCSPFVPAAALFQVIYFSRAVLLPLKKVIHPHHYYSKARGIITPERERERKIARWTPHTAPAAHIRLLCAHTYYRRHISSAEKFPRQHFYGSRALEWNVNRVGQFRSSLQRKKRIIQLARFFLVVKGCSARALSLCIYVRRRRERGICFSIKGCVLLSQLFRLTEAAGRIWSNCLLSQYPSAAKGFRFCKISSNTQYQHEAL
jgi:hypothetical protein